MCDPGFQGDGYNCTGSCKKIILLLSVSFHIYLNLCFLLHSQISTNVRVQIQTSVIAMLCAPTLKDTISAAASGVTKGMAAFVTVRTFAHLKFNLRDYEMFFFFFASQSEN